MSATKKVVGVSVTDKVGGANTGFVHSLAPRAKQRTAWPWPRAALAIMLLSLLLWGGVAFIASRFFD